MGPVERSVREAVSAGDRLYTPVRQEAFLVDSMTDESVVLLLGAGRHRTVIPWRCLEGIPAMLGERRTTRIGGGYTRERDPDTLDGYLKQFVDRATAGWVAALLDRSGVVVIDPDRPATLKLSQSFRDSRNGVGGSAVEDS